MKQTMKTGFFRELKATRGRFISIMLLMFLSTFTLVGLKLVGPDIRMMANQYLDEYQLADISVISTYGLDEEDIETLNQIDGSAVEYGYFTDVTTEGADEAIRLYSEPEQISSFELVEGVMPTTANEIAISNQMKSAYPLNSTIKVTEKGSNSSHVLVETEYTVVGYVNSLEILSTMDLGATNVGTGTLTAYGVVSDDSFDSDVYMIARMYYQQLRDEDAFLDQYLNDVAALKGEVETALSNRPTERLSSIKSEASDEIEENLQKLKDAETELDDAEQELKSAETELTDAKTQLDEANQELVDGQTEIDEGTLELEDGAAELKAARAELDANQVELNSAQQEITAGYKQLEDGQMEIDSGVLQVESGQDQIDQSLAELEAGKSKYEQGIAELETNISNINLALTDPTLTETEVAEYNATLASLQTGLDQANGSYEQFIAEQYNPAITQLIASQSEIDASREQLASAQAELDANRIALDAAQIEINDGQAAIDAGYEQVNSGELEIATNRQKLIDAQAELDAGKVEYQEGLAEYQDGLAEYQDGLAEFNAEEPDARVEIADGYEEIEDAKAELDDLALPVYTVNTRSETTTSGGYQVLSSLATSIDKVANVFPILLYAVAALVTFTTMTRYVEDDRINTGTLLSLGYTEQEIIQKYVVYGAISSSVGSILGIILGAAFIPQLLYTAFRGEFTTPDLILTFDFKVALIAIIVSLLCAVIPAFLVARAEFKHSPASLLLPKPPSDGSKIFLERITPVWDRLSFSHKVTARNIFRYKKRMFMTIFGVSGSVALLFTGLAMQGSIGNVNELQFGEIINYDLITVVDEKIDDQDQVALNAYMESDVVSDYRNVYIENLTTTAGENNERQTITLTVADNFEDYINYRDRKTGESLNLETGEVIISERLATILELEVGDTFTVNSSENLPIDLKVGAITEMYMGHFMYASPVTYNEAFGTKPQLNSYLVKLEDNQKSAVTDVATEILKYDGVQTVMQNESLKTQVASMSNSLNSVMSLIIVLSGLLAIVILYNITNINVNERMRELSTTKVLGYYDNEVTMYIYRETIILSLIGIIVGYGFGRLIHLFMMAAVSPLNMMFDQSVVVIAFIAPAILIIVISVILGILVHRRLTKVDMLEALKSVE